MRWLFVAAAAAVLAAAGVSAAPAAQGGLPLLDPLALLPSPEELPSGFVYQPDRDQNMTGEDATGILREYRREDYDPDSFRAGFQIKVIVAATIARANEIFDTQHAELRERGWVIERLDDVIGERAAVGRFDAGGEPRRVEGVFVEYRIGPVYIGVNWGDYAALPNYDAALSLARLIEPRVRAALAASPPPSPPPPVMVTPTPTPRPTTAPPTPTTRPPLPSPTRPGRR